MDVRLGIPLLSLLVLVGGCEIEVAEQASSQSDGMRPHAEWWLSASLETRTFPLEHLTSNEAMALIGPYVYRDRPGAPGRISHGSDVRAISVRETPDNLDKIARMLEEFDVASAAVSYRLHFQVVVANGTASTDARLASVENELRKVFRFEGYSLVGEGYVTVSSGGFELTINDSERTSFYRFDGQIEDGSLALDVDGPRGSIETTLGFRPGQTLVLGSMPTPDQTVFIILHVADAEEGEPA